MSKIIEQVCYGIQSNNNDNTNIKSTITDLNGSFENKSIIQLNIQAFPGTAFHINNSTNTIIVGNTGIYEINLEGFNSSINQLNFEAPPNGGYIIVDYIYEIKEGIQ